MEGRERRREIKREEWEGGRGTEGGGGGGGVMEGMTSIG